MKSRVIAFLLSLVMAFSLLPTVALADNTGDPNIEGGGGNTGDSLSRANIWYDHVYLRNPPINDTTPGIGGECGIRISVVTANGYATKATFDWSNFPYNNPSSALAGKYQPLLSLAPDQLQTTNARWFSCNGRPANKLDYILKGSSLTLGSTVYSVGTPPIEMPVIIKTNGAPNIAAIRDYFTDTTVLKAVAQQAGLLKIVDGKEDISELTGGKYKLLLEPVLYFVYHGFPYAATATEAAMLNELLGVDPDGHGLRYYLGKVTHMQLPLAMYLERDDSTITALRRYPGTIPQGVKLTTDAIVPYMGVGVISFGGYTIKVRLNGEIVPELTTVKEGSIGDVIKKEDVDTSMVDPEWEIVDIENVPLEITEDPAHNIIIIDCKTDEGLLADVTINYYLDGKYHSSENFSAEVGTTITKDNVPMKGFPGYELDHIDGCPLVVETEGNVINVYLKSQGAPELSSMAKLYKDEYRTQVTKMKSGYGVYGLFAVDIDEYVKARSYPSWSVPGSCSAISMPPTPLAVKTYINIDVTATATFYQVSTLKDNKTTGQKITVPMKLHHKDGNTWYFCFPNNALSVDKLAKAYIPVAWKDGTDWTVQFDSKITWDEYWWRTGTATYKHGHEPKTKNGKSWSHTVTYHPLFEGRKDGGTTTTASAAIRIIGNMYEDDFTGDRH